VKVRLLHRRRIDKRASRDAASTRTQVEKVEGVKRRKVAGGMFLVSSTVSIL